MPHRVHAIEDPALGNSSYLLETGDGTAIAVDPRRDVDDLLDLARQRGAEITHVLETHLHADFVGGARELAAHTGAQLVAAADAKLDAPHTTVRAGDTLALGGAHVEVIATPGHTPEHLAYLVRAGGTSAVFSGGAMIAGGVARTDLTGAARTEDLAREQFRSVRRLLQLPGATPLYPTHGAGSFCSAGATRQPAGTIDDRRGDRLLAIDDEGTFVRELLASYGSFPPYFLHLREVNRAGAPLVATLPPPERLDPHTVAERARAGAHLIDARPAETFADAHPAGATSIAFRPEFASWLGWVVPFGAPFALVIDPHAVEDAVRLARRIGYDRLEGWTTFDDWRDAGLPVSSFERLEPAEAAERARAGATLLDVRQRSEHAASRIAGATHLEAGDVIAGRGPDAAEVVTYCGHGERSSTAASILEARGMRVANLRGGIDGWRRAGLPVEG